MFVICQELRLTYIILFNLRNSISGGVIIIPDLCLRKLRGENNEVAQVHAVSVRLVAESKKIEAPEAPALTTIPYAHKVRKRNVST